MDVWLKALPSITTQPVTQHATSLLQVAHATTEPRRVTTNILQFLVVITFVFYRGREGQTITHKPSSVWFLCVGMNIKVRKHKCVNERTERLKRVWHRSVCMEMLNCVHINVKVYSTLCTMMLRRIGSFIL